MKSFVIGIILFVVVIIGGMTALSFMDVDVPQKDMSVAIKTTAQSNE